MEIKVMSFNLRFDTESDGINAFSKRFWRVLDVINTEKPDIIGFQEVTDSMRARLRDEIKGYTTIGCGRNADCHGEAMFIAYRTELFELISCENVWLSETPDIPGTRYGGDHSGCPRMYISLLLKHNGIEKPFRFINTHLDHQGANGRYLEATQLSGAISKYKEKFVLTGDFNATPDAPEIKLITSSLCEKNAIDCTAKLGPTFHSFGRLAPDKAEKIDYIFTDAKCTDAYAVKDVPVNGQYYSDHNAVCALIEL